MDKQFIMILSFSLFCISVYKMRNVPASIYGRILFIGFSLIFIVLSGFFIASDYFTGHGIDEAVLYHLSYGLKGAGFLEYWKIVCIVTTLVIAGCIYLFRMLHLSKKAPVKNQAKIRQSTVFIFLLFSLALNPAVIDLFSLARADYKPVSNYSRYYKAPVIIKKPEVKRNFIYIYAESLERTYFDETIFPGLIKELRTFEPVSTYFTDIHEVYKTQWTIAGMTASQCGIPLETPWGTNSMSGMDTFLTGAVCLGDLLDREGYRLSYLGGASLDFAGKGTFYSTHGVHHIQGYDELLPYVPDTSYKNGWGLYDDTLFDIAIRTFHELSSSGESFGLFLLTLDTHAPEGHRSKSCNNIMYKDGSNPLLNAVACSDYLISRFVNRIMESSHGDNTVIVISSDHLAIRGTTSDLLEKGNRKNLFMIIDPDSKESAEITKKGSMLDIGPTMLHVLGYEGHIGLGRNLLGPENSLISEFDDFDNVLRSWKHKFMDVWEFPTMTDQAEINIPLRTIIMDDRTFALPVFMQFNEELEMKLVFPSYRFPGEKDLIHNFSLLEMDTPFIWVDQCSLINQFEKRLKGGGYCMIASKLGSDERVIAHIDQKMDLTADDLRKVYLFKTTDEIFYKNRKQYFQIIEEWLLK